MIRLLLLLLLSLACTEQRSFSPQDAALNSPPSLSLNPLDMGSDEALDEALEGEIVLDTADVDPEEVEQEP